MITMCIMKPTGENFWSEILTER